jgi:hypothetical protein
MKGSLYTVYIMLLEVFPNLTRLKKKVDQKRMINLIKIIKLPALTKVTILKISINNYLRNKLENLIECLHRKARNKRKYHVAKVNMNL